ncbi:FAD-binding oxidoreductase [Loktanella sp. SALINAS62]|uniref:NAD(P)/FAD-dependent oxidoreductase n=1 Tax=Loktanella sp. SALINAS62 TaxID=2706124 RepID=UPI001B8ADBD0|nr:FAD-binding oxidoreductase [Loktanella sp. SALINAS62]MBS1300982.1 FAD-binding oxidoreductase [Loktanella sp. SALINAS62]
MARDVTVRGAGVFGLSIAWACALRGARVQVIDPAGVASGASGGIVGALAPHVPEQWNDKKAFQLDSLLMAQAFWDGVADGAGMPTGYARSGRVQPLADAAAVALARSRSDSARELWGGQATWQVVDAPQGDLVPDSPTGLWVHDTLSALIQPRDATRALAQALVARGGVICTEGPDQGSVVWATGWQGLADMTVIHSRMVGTGVKGQAALLAHDARGQAQVFAGGVHIVPHHDGTTAVGSTTERDFDDPAATDAQLDEVIAAARAAVPALAQAPVIARWAGVRPRSRSRAPMLGHHPFRSGQFVANGGFKIGFGMAPKVAQVMADLILDDRDTIPDAFRAELNL